MYKYCISKKIVRKPLSILDKITITNSEFEGFLNNYIDIESLDNIQDLLIENKYLYIELISLNEKEVEHILSATKDYVEHLELFRCETELNYLNNCLKLKSVRLSYLDKTTSLWSLKNNVELNNLEITGCLALKDISGIKDSYLVDLNIKDDYKTIPNRTNVKVDDFSIFQSLKNLKNLSLFILDNDNKDKDLQDLSKLTNLDKLFLPKDYFTFKQFAFLKSRLVNTSNIDSIYHLAKDPSNEKVYYIVIGKDKEDFLYYEDVDYNVFIKEYNELVNQFKKVK